MTKPQIIQEKAMSLISVKEELARITKRDGELNFRANKTQDYLNTVVTISSKKAKELYKALEGLDIPRLKESHLQKIVDICPSTVKELKVLLQGYTLTVSNDNMAKVVETISKNT